MEGKRMVFIIIIIIIISVVSVYIAMSATINKAVNENSMAHTMGNDHSGVYDYISLSN